MFIKRYILAVGLLSVCAITASSALAASKSCDTRVNNTHKKLLECVTIDGAREHQAALQAIADDNGGIRTSGTPGYDGSVDYVAERMTEAGYDVVVQPFDFIAFIKLSPSVLEQTAPSAVLYIEETDYTLMSQTDAGDVSGQVSGVDLALADPAISTSGCEASDFLGFPPGNIALIQRGACSFQLKAENAEAAGAVGAIIFNQGNNPSRTGLINGTLGTYSGNIPVVFATFDRGVEWAGTAGLVMHLKVDVLRGVATSYNVLAESNFGDASNMVMVGAHLDSVNQGPGIQDNGSGSAAILEVAEQMARVKPRNKVRFAWWGAEESGLVGSTHYVDNLSQDELDDIALYLNFDMIGSPNHVFMIYDGDDSDGIGAGPGPEGSAQIEEIFEEYYTRQGWPFRGADFSGRSDYGPFIAVGIPAGGLFTGAEGIKTPDEVALWGGSAGDQYDPCYHLACDTFDNINLDAYNVNVDAVAYSVLQTAMNTNAINGKKGKGNFKPGKKGKGNFKPVSEPENLGPLKLR